VACLRPIAPLPFSVLASPAQHTDPPITGRCFGLVSRQIVWRDQADHAAQSLSKGSRVVVVSRLQQCAWTAEDGSARSVVEVVAEELGPSLRWVTATTTRATRSQGE